MIRPSTWLLALVALTAWAGPATAQPQAEQPVVAVLPLAATGERMHIYGAPIANAVAERLRAEGAFRVEPVSLSGMLPTRVDLVVDGRIVTGPAGEVHLEARVRDPERGITVASVSTGARALAEIDRLTAELAAALAPRLGAAVDARRRAEPSAARAAGDAINRAGTGADTKSTAPAAAPAPSQPATSPALAAGSPARDQRPVLVVFGATGQAAGGAVPVDEVATRAGHRLAHRLGFRPVAAGENGVVAPDVAVAALRRAEAPYGLMLKVHGVRFSWKGVLTARAAVRVILVDTTGRALYDRTHRTGTLVGSRGDRHPALVRYALAQTVDIFAPEMTRALAALARSPAGAP